jgi:uncharacterized protein YjbI with pentapeptide repeats
MGELDLSTRSRSSPSSVVFKGLKNISKLDRDDVIDHPRRLRISPAAQGSRKVKDLMADYSREEVLEKIKKGESLERAVLEIIALNQANLENANLRRSDLEGCELRREQS